MAALTMSSGQGVHTVAPGASLYELLPQGAHAVPLAAAYVPASHTVQLDEKTSETLPDSHGEQVAMLVALVTFEAVPAGQRPQLDGATAGVM